MSEAGPQNFAETSDQQALEVIQFLLLNGHLPENLPESVQNNTAMKDVVHQLVAIQELALSLANGNLEPELKVKGRVIGALKSLQANLRHLTWQVQRIAEGDMTQRVRFMGDFASAFNTMVDNLAQSHQTLELRAQELAEGRRAALNLMLDAQSARRETEAAFSRLQVQMEEIKVLQGQLREQAIRDPLTSCFNRRYLDETLGREFARAQREAYSLSLVMIDIDEFKKVNDQYGHQAGDAVLKALGTLLRGCIRAGDIVCRYGGEEFLMVLPYMKLHDAMARSEVCRNMFQGLDVSYEGVKLYNTISLGVASYPLNGTTSEMVIKAADQGLYLAKHAGRNCVRTPK
jgi:diguanylate cyclase (GGDEF)-like protein